MSPTVTPERLKGMLGAGLVQGAILYLLIAGLVVRLPGVAEPKSPLFALAPPPPPPEVKVETKPKPSHKTEGAAAPPNIRSKATEITAPPVPPPPLPPPPMTATAKPFDGSQSTQGAAPVAGPGTGAGGVGNGTGSGGAGNGDGGGYDRDTPPRQYKGRLKAGDVPEPIWTVVRGEATVGVRYRVETDGSVTNCRATRSSGNRELDQLTCSLIEERFRFRPARDEDGDPFPSYIVENHTWVNPRDMDSDDR